MILSDSEDSPRKPLLARAIDFIINHLLFISLLALFIVMSGKLFGNSKLAQIAGFGLSTVLASVCYNLLSNRFTGFVTIGLFSVPAFALALIFL